jgi:raffinose/stachyose/melibiose transport system permease protein
MNSLTNQKKLFIVSFLFIPVLLLLLFVVYPMLSLLWMSFTSWDGVTSVKEFIFLDNYKKMLLDSPNVWLSLKNNGVYFFVHLLFIPIELMVAVVLDSRIRAAKFFKTVVFMPYIVNGVAIAYAFSFFYSPYNGALNEILRALGLSSLQQSWLGDEHIVNYSLTVISLWKYCGFHIILFLAGLQTIPRELVEASVVDGANAPKRFLYVTIPSIKTVIQIILFLNIRGSLQVFDIPFVTTGGGPGYASSTFTVYTLATAFTFNNFGMASTMGVTLMFLIIVLSWVQRMIFNMAVKEDKVG